MLTILAWIVFVFATVWNILFWTVGAFYTIKGESTNVKVRRTVIEAAVSLSIWFIPGVYLFGLF